MSDFAVERYRRQFPALAREIDGRPVVYFDGPAGSQVPQRVIEAVGSYLADFNANCGGAFATSAETDRILEEVHRAVADFLGTGDPELVTFGPNMTTMTLALSRALARTWKPGDEVLVTNLEHDANFTPWVQAAADAGATLRRVEIRPDDCTLDMDDLRSKLNENTRLVAVGSASNAVGTINPAKLIVEMAHDAGALVFLDAVHYAPHAPIDVEAWDCDFLACSAYKFFGPHVGVLWGKRHLLERLPVYKLRPSTDALPGRWMTGTQNHEGMAGTEAAIGYLADIGRSRGGQDLDRRAALLSAFEAIRAYERGLALRLLEGLSALPEVRVYGITAPQRVGERVPTVSFTHARKTPHEVARYLGQQGIFVWHGNYYALPLTETLGLEPEGMVRVGLMHYNTAGEVDRLLTALDAL